MCYDHTVRWGVSPAAGRHREEPPARTPVYWRGWAGNEHEHLLSCRLEQAGKRKRLGCPSFISRVVLPSTRQLSKRSTTASFLISKGPANKICLIFVPFGRSTECQVNASTRLACRFLHLATQSLILPCRVFCILLQKVQLAADHCICILECCFAPIVAPDVKQYQHQTRAGKKAPPFS